MDIREVSDKIHVYLIELRELKINTLEYDQNEFKLLVIGNTSLQISSRLPRDNYPKEMVYQVEQYNKVLTEIAYLRRLIAKHCLPPRTILNLLDINSDSTPVEFSSDFEEESEHSLVFIKSYRIRSVL